MEAFAVLRTTFYEFELLSWLSKNLGDQKLFDSKTVEDIISAGKGQYFYLINK